MIATSVQDLSHVSERDFIPARGTWMVLWTKSRQEKAVARFCQSIGAEYYLPLIQRVHFVRRRKIRSPVPLFPGYVFLAGQREDGFAALATKRVCQVIFVPHQQQFVHEISQIHRTLLATQHVEPCAFAVRGQRCRIIRGPLRGIEGIVTNQLGPSRLVLQLGILGQGASLEIDTDLLEPLD